ncbi:putative metal-dependent hydrolase [Subsaxibacter sp. CAU 1640]|uniref:YfiT family bacillithiol transferase n=1 Tax=Subsaxibacter sp. CAU 1640 TaxID=2933271 RepID=UPI002005BF19|nr:putative metal-dependent hydrolase [Subsaxibacter sp. CAU 1640]MCK7592005.1 putative metal-dependent hydrolase [Subsaxibacter sp. CAU 1640]
MDLETLKYPIGKFHFQEAIDESKIKEWISDIEQMPKAIEDLVRNLSVEELNLPYRPDGWKIKQVVHHLADSHMNAFIRFKLTLTEDSPIIKPYQEAKWAELEDGTSNEVSDSLQLLKALHSKWATLLKTMNEDDFKRVYVHPEHNKRFQLTEALAMYSWHCNHHLEHIKQALHFRGNF